MMTDETGTINKRWIEKKRTGINNFLQKDLKSDRFRRRPRTLSESRKRKSSSKLLEAEVGREPNAGAAAQKTVVHEHLNFCNRNIHHDTETGQDGKTG